ncbi:MAG: hypothetical protein U1E38_00600 [Rhodospirillales bacterium]
MCAAAASVTVIADRESDIFEAFAQRPEGVGLVVRAAHDRSLSDGQALFAAIKATPAAGQADLELPARPGRQGGPPGWKPLPGRWRWPGRRADAARAFPPASPSTSSRCARSTRRRGDGRLLAAAAPSPALPPTPGRWPNSTGDAGRSSRCSAPSKTEGFDIEDLRIEERARRANRLVTAALIAAVCIQQLVRRDGGPAPLRR